MGNCVFKGFSMEVEETVKVVTTNGGIMELYAPITAESITNEFPGHAIYRSRDFFSEPLLHNEELLAGQLYYLIPLDYSKNTLATENKTNLTDNIMSCTSSRSKRTHYRMSVDDEKILKRSTEAEVFPRYNSSGVWKVKLVINPEQLSEILAQDARTEELIESVRTVAKCGNGAMTNSDKWCLSSSWRGWYDVDT